MVNTPQNYEKERKQQLNAIKEYILSLLQKSKKIQEKTREEIKETIEQEEKKRPTSIFDKIKEKLTSKSQEKTSNEKKPNKWWFELPSEDTDEYIPQDSEFGEALGESKRFAEVYPPYIGYFTQGKKSFFNPQTNLRSKKKELTPLSYNTANTQQIKYTYAGYVQSWITAIPLPQWAMPNTTSLKYHGTQEPIRQNDQNSCIYIVSTEKQAISFEFTLNQTENNQNPIPEDKEKIIFDTLSNTTQDIMQKIENKPAIEQAKFISHHIKTSKKYNTNQQWSLRDKSNNKNYISNLDRSPILECFSANSLLVALCRELDIPSRLIVWHMIQAPAKDGKAHLSNNNGHARTEIRDGTQRQRLDATPTTKENGEPSNESMEDQEQNQPNQSADGNIDDGADNQNNWENNASQEQEGAQWQEWETQDNATEWPQEEWKDQGSDNDTFSDQSDTQKKQQWQMSWPREQRPQSSKSAEQMLDEFIKKAKEDNFTAQWEQLTKTLEQLEQAETKEDIKKILDASGLSDFAKEEVDKIGNEGILEEEKNELKDIDDEAVLEQKLKESLLNPEYKQKLNQYADTIKKRIQEQKQRMQAEMQRFGFNEKETALYKQYKELEKEVSGEVKKQIQELQRLLPPQYIVHRDEDNYYRSGSKLDRNKLVDRKVNGNTKMFQRSKITQDTQEINMFETIIIDRSWSMGNFDDTSSPFFQSIKAAITRAKVLEHFQVDMSIVIFDDSIDEVMSFGETFSARRTRIPSKLMRAATSRSGWNSQEPITHVYYNMRENMKKKWGRSFWNISFIGDGDLYNHNQVPTLKAMIDDLKKQWMGVTAYYINQNERKMPLIQYYFGTPEGGNAIYAKDSDDLSSKIIGNHKTKLNLLIRKYLKT